MDYLAGNRDHPRNIECRVRPGRYFNGPHGEHAPPYTTVLVAEVELEPNKSILVVVGSDEDKAIMKARRVESRDRESTAQGASRGN